MNYHKMIKQDQIAMIELAIKAHPQCPVYGDTPEPGDNRSPVTFIAEIAWLAEALAEHIDG